MEPELRELLDRQRIRDCMARYARGIDRYDEALVRSAFHPDATDCHGPFTVGLEEFFASVLPTVRDREATQHYLMNQHVEFEGPDGANVETYFVVVRKMPGHDGVEQMGGRYVDRFERRDGDWRIALRVLVVDWQAVADGSGMAHALAVHHRGSADKGDPSYERPLRTRAPA
jgi:hypothetical protein